MEEAGPDELDDKLLLLSLRWMALLAAVSCNIKMNTIMQ